MKKISKELTDFFKAQGITQDTIAAQLGETQQYISGLLSGKKAVGKKLVKITTSFDMKRQ